MDVSIIIPCYNSGAYLPDALASISAAPVGVSYEVIIVDDGSTEPATISFLKQLDKEQYKVIFQENKGPAGARNTGIRNATGRYLLFLDSDNKIRPEYLDKGTVILDVNPKTGVVYGNVAFFGADNSPRFTPQPFDLPRLLAGNYIDMCAMVRKAAWESAGGFDEDRAVMGHEDWDLWISIADKGWGFHFIDEVLFDYRNLSTSLIATTYNKDSFHKTRAHIYSKFLGKAAFRLLNKLHEPLTYYSLLFRIDKAMFFKQLLRKLNIG